jgi:hypothetical protein
MTFPNAATLSEFTNTKVISYYIYISSEIYFQKTTRSCRYKISLNLIWLRIWELQAFSLYSFDKGILRIKVF